MQITKFIFYIVCENFANMGIKSLNITDKTTESEIEDFIFKASPYSTRTGKFEEVIKKLRENKLATHGEAVGASDRVNKSELFFLVWRKFDNSKIFAGTKFIPHTEITTGINFFNHEPSD